MKDILSVENMRKSDAATIKSGISGRELMARAGKAIYESVDWECSVAIVCGVGNNAGDGYVLAGLLKDKNIDCTLILLENRFSEDGRYYYDICIERKIPVIMLENVDSLKDYTMAVDCIFGTGFKGGVKGKAKTAIDLINTSGAYVVAVDINSGLNGDSGMAEPDEKGNPGCVYSDITISIGSYKPGHFLSMAKDVMKKKANCDIGIRPVEKPYGLIEGTDFSEYFSARKNFSNKGTYGYTAIIGGSKKYSGALRLACMANAAMKSGAGVVKVGLPNSLYHDLIPLILESTVFPLSDNDGEICFNENELKELVSNVRTAAFGMGIGISPETSKCLEYLLKNFTGTLIVDADGLTMLSKLDRDLLRHSKCRTVLTPHLREFERLTGAKKEEILSNPVKLAETYALDTGAVVLLKGPSTIITDGVRTYITDTGCSGMATAGSGDVLSGILSAVCSYIPNLPLAVAAGAYINGTAGELAQEKTNAISMTAGDTASSIAEVITKIGNRT